MAPPFTPEVGIPEFREWCRQALAHPERQADYKKFKGAYEGDSVALRSSLREAYTLEQSQLMMNADEEWLGWKLHTLLIRVGDERFVRALEGERPEVRAAARQFLQIPELSRYPKTESLLKLAPKVDFPLERAHRRN